MALTPPESRHWYKEPLHKMEVVWITIAFLWGLVMFFTMVYWHINGTQNLSNEAYRVIPEEYGEKVEAFAEKYKVREEADIPVVKPPAGSDVYLLGRLWEWWPILELEKGKTYRLHMSSMDWQHGFSLQPANINIQVHPNYEMVLTMTPDKAGEYGIVCNEYCGVGHHQMLGKIYVK
ncbi:MAG: cytochrome C oxidase subunit II [Rhodospirillaceae bacterium]|jgi:cytochrome c oxidase subunit II|nr:cytochrome C oxidase subunit II [Rhodospirillaceae bacterium]